MIIQSNTNTITEKDSNTMANEVYGLTYNGAKSYLSTSNTLLDLFSMIGSARNNRSSAVRLYRKAVSEDRLNSYKLLFWLRDCRGGGAEKTTFHVLLAYELRELFQAGKRDMFDALLKLVPSYGYWKDLLIVAQLEPLYAEWIFDFLAASLKSMDEESSLLAKYMPRPRGGKKKKKLVALEKKTVHELEEESLAELEEESLAELEEESLAELDNMSTFDMLAKAGKRNKAEKLAFEKLVIEAMCQRLGIGKKDYRKLVVSHTQVVEQVMSKKKWNTIDYTKLPSAALMLYKKTFGIKDKHRYTHFLRSLSKKPEGKLMNNTHMLPHELAFDYSQSRIKAAEFNAYWSQLNSYEGLNGIITMVDSSGSMSCRVHGSKYRCIDVSKGLGLYVSSKQSGPFKNQMLVFSSSAEWLSFDTNSSPAEMFDNIPEIVENTDFELAYKKVLQYGLDNCVSAADMPKAMMVLSDMEFDCASSGEVAFEDMKKLFNEAGYELPKLVFWNLNGRDKNVQVQASTPYTFLISGFSTSILKSFVEYGLSGLSKTPLDFMNEVLSSERYQAVQDALLGFLDENQ